jgi:RNA polymerase sigma factor for flagellar operon FliA
MPRSERSGSAEDVFLSQLDVIERVISFVSSRHHLPGIDADDFSSHVKLKLIEDDYAVLRKFEGRSSLRTYLTVVVQRLFLDYRISAWGKWRPSAEAKRSGEVAILLERLMQREGYGFEEACELMETNYQVTLPRAEIEAIAARLPQRFRRRFESDAGLIDLPADQPSLEEVVAGHERVATAARLEAVLNEAMGRLDPQDRLIFELQYRDGRSIADIARALRLDQKALYRRVDGCKEALLADLQAAGMDKAQVSEILQGLTVSIDWRAGTRETARLRSSIREGEH